LSSKCFLFVLYTQTLNAALASMAINNTLPEASYKAYSGITDWPSTEI
ncbi:hypothetical protein CI238_11512, partial [Colletotrichum incanum]